MTIQGNITTFNPQTTVVESAGLGGTLKKYLYHWPIFVLAALIILPLTYVYVSSSVPVYDVKASFMIKDDKKNQTTKSTSALHEIDLIYSAKIIENEIEILKSQKLITKVVNDLNLWVNYQQVDGLKTIDLYESSPVKLNLFEKKGLMDNKGFEITIKDKNTYDVKGKNGLVKNCVFGKKYRNELGLWSLDLVGNIADYQGKKIKLNLTDPETLVFQYRKAIDASLSNKLSSALVLKLSDQSAQRGKDILNHLIMNYNLETANDKNTDLKNTIQFLDNKIAELSTDLGASEKSIENFKSEKGLTDIGMQSKVSLENLQTNDAKLGDVDIQLDIINRIDRYVNSSQNSAKIPSSNGIEDAGLSSLIEKLSKLQLEYQELAANTPETSPEFEPINRQIRSTESSIKETVKNIKLSLRNKRDKLQAYNSSFESSIRSIPTQERQYINIKREQQSKEGLYTYYLQKREEAAANYAAIVSDDKIIDEAYSSLPKSVDKIAYGMALLFSFVLPIGIVYARGAFSNKIISSADIKEQLETPIIAELPYQDDKDKLVIDDKLSSPVSEQIRTLRTKLHYLHKDKSKGRVTLISSSIPGEGKSFVSANLSVSLAYAERKTIILELDMRKPKIMNTFNLPADTLGLSDYFMDRASISDIIQCSKVDPNLFIISSGSVITNPSELLERKGLAVLLNTLKESFDDIIIDSPPAHLVADAMIVSPLTDLCLYVIRQGYTDKTELSFLKELIVQKQISNVNIVFNGLEKQKFGYGYDYSNEYYHTKKSKSGFGSMFNNLKSRF